MNTIRMIFPLAALGLFALSFAPACSKSEAKTDPAKTASSASKTTAAPAAAKGSDKKADKKKGGGKHEAKAAQESKQKLSSTVKDKKDKAEKKTEKTEDGLDCTADIEGLAWCESDSELLFCSDGEWFQLECDKVESGAFCAFNLDDLEVGCFKDAE